MRFSNLTSQQSLLGTRFCNYVPAVLKHSDSRNLGWFIEFFCADASSSKMKRYRIKMNSLLRTSISERDFALQANNLVSELNQNLYHGWVPTRTTVSAESMYQSMAMQSSPMRQMMYAQACQPMLQFVMPQGAYAHTYSNNNVQVPVMPTMEAPKVETSFQEETTAPEVVSNEIDSTIMPELPNDVLTEEPASEPTPEIMSAQPEEQLGMKITDMMAEFLEDRKPIVRPATFRSYKTLVKSMGKYIEQHYPDMRCREFTIKHAKEYVAWKEESMKETKENRNSNTKYGVSDRSVNNVIKGMRLVMGFAVEMKYMDENPFEKVKTRVVTSKRRELVDEDTLKKIDTHLRTTNQRGFLLVCMLLYNTFLRPNEIRQLQIKDVHLFDHKIILPGEAAKNKYERTVGLSEDIERLMLSLGIQNADQYDYLVGKDFKICDTMAPEHDYRVAWGKMRDELGLPEEMQLYSLKDTGITDSLESGIPSIDVMKQAGHHDLRITTKYASHEDKKLASKMYEKGLRFAK